MQYKFAQKQDYSAYASGGVFYSLPGHPALPVRLASEIFQRCLAVRAAAGLAGPCTLYDPCCGGAYHLAVLAYLHRDRLNRIIGSDVDPDILEVAGRNLELLSPAGLDGRIAELAALVDRYHKESHKTALAHARHLKDQLARLARNQPLATRLFRANAADIEALNSHLAGETVDVVISDLPYGRQTAWEPLAPARAVPGVQVEPMLEGLRPALSAGAAVAIIADKKQRIGHEKYHRLERFQLGKRQVVLLQPQP